MAATPASWILDEIRATDRAAVGRKAAGLGELLAAGFPVPPGFVFGVTAYDEYLDGSGAAGAIRERLASFEPPPAGASDLTAHHALADDLTAVLAAHPVPAALSRAIAGRYETLCESIGTPGAAVAVRSSGPESRPGQFETVLEVVGPGAVVAAAARVWASTFNARSLLTRDRAGLPLEREAIAVLVQPMVVVRAAGVMFTMDPLSGDRSRVVIEGVAGGGMELVGGEVTPDRWSVDRVTGEVGKRHVAAAGAPCLADEEVGALVQIGARIERHLGPPQDVEWVLGDGGIQVVQSRPVRRDPGGEAVLELGDRSWGELMADRYLRTEEKL